MTAMTSAAAGTWLVDLARTRATFTARHGLGPAVHGTIAVTAGTVDVGQDGQPRRLRVRLDPASIDSGHARRDADLRGRRFLAVDSYPLMEVVADRIEETADGWSALATLRAHGREAPLRITATLDSAATAPRLRVTGAARLDLRDLGIRVPGFLVRRRVELSATAELTRQADGTR
jgi:polyisoprenoid-binding protein YceI